MLKNKMNESTSQTAMLAKWGNSLAIRLPKKIINAQLLREGDAVEIESSGETIVIKKVSPPKHYNLKDILGCFSKSTDEPEVDWGRPQGQEFF